MSQIFLYLPSGYLISEKLLYLLKFQTKQQVQVKLFKPMYNQTPDFLIKNVDLETLSLNKIKFEDTRKNENQCSNSCSYQRHKSISSHNSLELSDNSIERTEFKKNRTINENLSKRKLKHQNLSSKKSLDINLDHLSLVVDKKLVCSEFVDIVLYLFKNVDFVGKIQTQADQKFLNHLNFIQIYFDQVTEYLMSFIYNEGKNIHKNDKKMFQTALKILHENLTYFENYLLEEDVYLFDSQFSFIDLSMLVILQKAFRFLLGEKIRKKTFPNLLIWLKKQNLYYYEELSEFKLTQFCVVPYSEKFFTCDNKIFELKSDSHKEIWTLDQFKQELNKLIKRRNFCITQNSIFKIGSQQFSIWKFEFILTETDSDENEFNKNQKEICNFQQRLEQTVKDLQNQICIYIIHYSQCDEEAYYFQTEEETQMCSKHTGRYFRNLNLCGVIFYEGNQLPNSILKYESSDEIHLEKIQNCTNDLFQQIFLREKEFAFEKVFKEIII